jgi:hypothetical protein
MLPKWEQLFYARAELLEWKKACQGKVPEERNTGKVNNS